MPLLPGQPVIIYLVAHQTKYLDLVFAGLARQTRKPDLVVTSCDTDNPAIGEVVRDWTEAVGVPMAWIRRAHHGIARCSQVRNNAARYIINDQGITDGHLIQLDADMLAPPTLVERHAEHARRAELVYCYRVDVPQDVSATLDARAIAAGADYPPITSNDRNHLARRDRRYRRQILMRRLRLGPPHKPKLLGSNWSGSLSVWRTLNGFDEHYQGWGFLDDEFARRAARAKARCSVAVADIPAFHLYHPTRQPPGPMARNPNYQRFLDRALPIRAARGIENPLDQNPVQATLFRPGQPSAPAVETQPTRTS